MDEIKETIILLKMIIDLMKSALDFFQDLRKKPRNGRKRVATNNTSSN